MACRDVKVLSATLLPTKHFVYNLSVENHNEYIVNGLLSHNTDPLRYSCVRIHDLLFGGNIMPKDDIKSNPMELKLDGLMDLSPSRKNDMGWAYNAEEVGV